MSRGSSVRCALPSLQTGLVCLSSFFFWRNYCVSADCIHFYLTVRGAGCPSALIAPSHPKAFILVWDTTGCVLNEEQHVCAAVFTLLLSPQRHFSVFALSFPGPEALSTIYTSILLQHLRGDGFSPALQKSCPPLVQLALALHLRVASTFLPTAVKFHYIFNLRDLSNIFQVAHRRQVYQEELSSPLLEETSG